jgi:hypothetical protein
MPDENTVTVKNIYEQQYAHFRGMNDILYKMPPIFATVLGMVSAQGLGHEAGQANFARPRSPSHASSQSSRIACGSTEPILTGRTRRLPRNEHRFSVPAEAGKDLPARTMAVVRSSDFLQALDRRDRACNIDPPSRLTPSCGGHVPTAERTLGLVGMIAESLTPQPGIREHNPPGRWGNRPALLRMRRERLLDEEYALRRQPSPVTLAIRMTGIDYQFAVVA